MKKILLIIWLLLYSASNANAICSWVGNTGTVASPYSATEIQDCLTGSLGASSKTGQVIVQIPNCNATAGTITINMRSGFTNVTALTIRGQYDCNLDGNGRPTACGTNLTNFYVTYTGKDGRAFRLAHMRITGTSGLRIDGDSKTWRIDHTFWDGVSGYSSSRLIWFAKSVATYLSEGVIDHNYFKNWSWGAVVHAQPSIDGGNYEWMIGPQLGTSHAVYIESNKLESNIGGNYTTENNGASRWVIRHNELINCSINGHDAQVGGYRGGLKNEIYNNTFNYTISGNWFVLFRPGANGVFFNNTITWSGLGEISSYPLYFSNYRNAVPTGWPYCSNTSGKMFLDTTASGPQTCTVGTGCINIDGSASSPNGYPCRDQTGVSGNNPQVGGGQPWLFWNNTINGVNAVNAIGVGYGASHSILNREWCSHVTTMPASCNGVTTTYAPMAYPHFLVTGDPPPTITTYTVTPVAGSNAYISPVSAQTITSGLSTSFTVTVDSGYVASATGCQGNLVGTTYTTGGIYSNCTVTASATAYFNENEYIEAEAGTLTSMLTYTTGGVTWIFGYADDTGYTTYPIYINQAGVYKLEVRTNSQEDAGQNSFYIGFDGEATQGNPAYSYNAPVDADWIWDDVNIWGSGSPQYDPKTWTLSQGLHILKVYTKERYTQLDKLRLVPTDANVYSISGILHGLKPGLSITLQNNGANDLVATADGAYTFSAGLTTGQTYSISISSQPAGMTCLIAIGGTGTVNVTDIIDAGQVVCYWTITSSAGTGCNISPEGPTEKQGNQGAAYIFTADPNYSVSSAGGTCSGVLVGGIYGISNVTSDCTVIANCIYNLPLGLGAVFTLSTGQTSTFTLSNDGGKIIIQQAQ